MHPTSVETPLFTHALQRLRLRHCIDEEVLHRRRRRVAYFNSNSCVCVSFTRKTQSESNAVRLLGKVDTEEGPYSVFGFDMIARVAVYHGVRDGPVVRI